MIKPTIAKIERVGTSAGYGKGFWALLACLVFAAASIVQIESSRVTSEVELASHPESGDRLPSSVPPSLDSAPHSVSAQPRNH